MFEHKSDFFSKPGTRTFPVGVSPKIYSRFSHNSYFWNASLKKDVSFFVSLRFRFELQLIERKFECKQC
jgi:hypothetical protein